MANIKAKIRQTNTLKGKTSKNNEVVAQTVKLSQGSIALGDLADVDTSGQSDGVMMIFNGTTGKYEVKTNIENENLSISGGLF
jgi:hypothetical protein|tara:strand:- start:1893 stop:2141 length:249 start_codon:yes stop_codon:yes gene_type:complete